MTKERKAAAMKYFHKKITPDRDIERNRFEETKLLDEIREMEKPREHRTQAEKRMHEMELESYRHFLEQLRKSKAELAAGLFNGKPRKTP